MIEITTLISRHQAIAETVHEDTDSLLGEHQVTIENGRYFVSSPKAADAITRQVLRGEKYAAKLGISISYPTSTPTADTALSGITERQLSYLTSLLRQLSDEDRCTQADLISPDGQVNIIAIQQLTKATASARIDQIKNLI